MAYVELHAHSAYSFLDGASLPEELAVRAAELGYEALALTDHDGVYGSLEFAHAAKHFGVRPITGAEVTLADESHVTLLVENARGYSNLCRLLTAAHAHTRDTTNREPRPPRRDQVLLEELNEGLVCLSGCARDGLGVRDPNAAARLARAFGRDRFYVELQRPYERGDTRRNAHLRDLAASLGVRTVATGDAHAHDRRRAALQDVLVAVRCRTSLEGCEQERRGNHESVLLSPEEMRDRFRDDLDAVHETTELAGRLEFDLTEELGYRYPDFSDGEEPAIVRLRRVCEAAFAERYSNLNGHKRRVRRRLEEELALIDELGLAGFFLLHWEVLELAREVALEVRGPGSVRHVLPPGRGRGSSVGSLVCYLTGLSHVDPVANNLSLGRFLNRELASVPDIDLDFPRDIREKLIVRVVERYGSEHASLVAAFATYRSRGAIRDVGKALGLPYADLERLARLTDGWNAQRVADEIAALPDAATKLRSPRWRAFGALCAEIAGLPRHISQHPGGMVISSRPLVELVPVQPAAMQGRQMCQWDKDSCADAGFLKIVLLGLGMLSAVEECVDLVARHRSERIDLSRVPLHDPEVFAEIQRADTVGCFQIESRAQMQVILRTRPETIDDITVQVALVRPGPIQGKAVHPYVERRQLLRDDPGYRAPADHPLLEEPLRETLGVVVFQDQVLDVAVHLAGFSVGEAEGLRRAMSRKRSHAALEAWRGGCGTGAAAEGGGEAEEAEAVAAKRPYSWIRELAQRTGLSEDELRALAESGACDCFRLRRRELLWQLGLVPRPASVPGTAGEAKQLALPLEPTVATPELPQPTVWERMLADYRTTSLSVGVHPLELLRPHLPRGTLSSEQLRGLQHGESVRLAGLVVARQRPAAADGVVFMLLEDELTQVNLIVLPQVYERFRAVVRSEPLLLVRGRYEHSDRNRNILVDELVSLAPLARSLTDGADVHAALPRAHHFGHR